MDLEKKLEQKLKYLILMELRENYFDIHDCDIELIYTQEKVIEYYEITLKFEYNGSIDADWNDFQYDMQKMFTMLEEAIMKFPITPKGTIDLSYRDFYISNPMLWEFDFSYDTKHSIHCSYKVNLSE